MDYIEKLNLAKETAEKIDKSAEDIDDMTVEQLVPFCPMVSELPVGEREDEKTFEHFRALIAFYKANKIRKLSDLEKRIFALSCLYETAKIVQSIKVKGGMLHIYEYNDWDKSAVIIYDDNTLFQMEESQSQWGLPSCSEDIKKYTWLDEEGYKAKLEDGMPVLKYKRQ